MDVMDKKALVGNLADADQVKGAEQEHRRRSKAQLVELAEALANASSRRVLARFIGACGVFDSRFRAGEEAQFYAGIRHAAYLLITELQRVDPDIVGKLTMESREVTNGS